MLKFAQDSSIHGLKFIFDPNYSKFIKYFWFVSFLFSIGGFCFYSYESFMTWHENPEILVKIRERRPFNFPMPAVTICPNLFTRGDFLWIKKILKNDYRLTMDECKYYLANEIWCNFWHNRKVQLCNEFENETIDYLRLINITHHDASEFGMQCRSTKYCENIAKIFTPFGICFTTNMRDLKDIINSDVIGDNFLYSHTQQTKILLQNETLKPQWTPKKGYADPTVEFPWRARKGTEKKFFLKYSVDESKNYCFQRAFAVVFHLPTEIPSIFHDYFIVNYKTTTNFIVTIKSAKTDEYLKKFSISHRKCYFDGEKQLKYFQIYTKKLCEVECNINQTLKHCNCSHIAMPRENSTRICLFDDLPCVKKQLVGNSINDENLFSCGCLRTCDDVKYTIRMDEIDMDDEANFNYKNK